MPAHISEHIWIEKSEIPKPILRWMKCELRFPDAEGRPCQAWAESEDGRWLIIPRGPWLEQGLSWPELEDRRCDRPMPNFPDAVIELRQYQRVPINKLRRKGGGILHAPTGSGKTVLFLYLFSVLKQRTLVIVHTKDLMHQWIARANMVLGLNRREIGQWGGGKSTVGRHLTIAMVQSLTRLPLAGSDWASQFGCVVLDETHRAPAETFARVVQSFPARYIYGATATPTRPDGMHPLMHALIGPTVATIKEQKLVEDGSLVRPRVEMIETEFDSRAASRLSRYARQGNGFMAQNAYKEITNELILDLDRNELIADKIMSVSDRHVLVLSDRIEHLQQLSTLCHTRDWQLKSHVLTGRVDARTREEIIDLMRQRKLNVIFATQLADEGLDIDVLDTLVLTYPLKALEKLQQRVGRIKRSAPGKTEALVLDFVDSSVHTLRKHATGRHGWYTEQQCETEGWNPPLTRKPNERTESDITTKLNSMNLLGDTR